MSKHFMLQANTVESDSQFSLSLFDLYHSTITDEKTTAKDRSQIKINQNNQTNQNKKNKKQKTKEKRELRKKKKQQKPKKAPPDTHRLPPPFPRQPYHHTYEPYLWDNPIHHPSQL